MGKRRKTAKTGDKSLYKKGAEANSSRANTAGSARASNTDDSFMYNDVDQYHNEKDQEFMKLNEDNDKNSSDEEDQEEAVMDLGVGGQSSSDDEDDEDSDSEQSDALQKAQQELAAAASSSEDDDEDDEVDAEDIRDWGKRKSAYYHGDTADLELGQDEEDAFLEEEAAKEVQAARYDDMAEEDFMLSDDDDDEKQDDKKKSKGKSSTKETETTAVTNRVSSIRDVSKLSQKDKRKLIEKQHPGLLQILSHFSETVQDLQDRTSLATSALCDGEDDGTAEAVGATKAGKKYLLTKALVQSTTALNLAMFLLLKADETVDGDDPFVEATTSSMVQFHPVMKRLQQWNVLGQKLKGKVEDKVEGLDEQLDNLIKASKMMSSMAQDDSSNGEESEGVEVEEEQVDSDLEKTESKDKDGVAPAGMASSSDSELSSEDEEAISRKFINDARFGLRPNEVAQDSRSSSTKARKRRGIPSDFGDDQDAGGDNKSASRYLSSAINSIEQRAASKKKKRAPTTSEDVVEHGAVDDDVRRGLEMMEAELGKASDDEGGGDAGSANSDGMSDDNGEGDFYSTMTKKSKAKKDFKKGLYKVAPKYPRLEGEIEGERGITRAIMKNRGLVPHKNKLNRNPRVKKREQYRKALIRRKGSVREVRTEEGHKYGGEETGIKSGVSRSRKLGAN